MWIRPLAWRRGPVLPQHPEWLAQSTRSQLDAALQDAPSVPVRQRSTRSVTCLGSTCPEACAHSSRKATLSQENPSLRGAPGSPTSCQLYERPVPSDVGMIIGPTSRTRGWDQPRRYLQNGSHATQHATSASRRSLAVAKFQTGWSYCLTDRPLELHRDGNVP